MAKSRNRKGVRKAESDKLWAASAGRCNICNTSLLRDETTGVAVKAGEKAHIVGVADGPRSPRGQHPLLLSERDLAENLILLCEKHHTEIDARPDLYSVGHLRELKRAFEERIFFLTSLSPERQTLVLRVLGNIHGSKTPDITREQAREVVLSEEGRYPRFALSATEHDASVDLRELTNEGEPTYWTEADGQIRRRIRHLQELRASGDADHVSVLALGRIPVLVCLGDAMGDAAETSIYHRRNQAGWGWDADAELPEFELIQHETKGAGSDVTLMCSVSAAVKFSRAPDELQETSRYEIKPANLDPGFTVLDHRQARESFARTYREFLSLVETEHLEAGVINVLPAVPADAAITLGQVRTPAANPPLRVYDLDKAKKQYVFACEVGQ